VSNFIESKFSQKVHLFDMIHFQSEIHFKNLKTIGQGVEKKMTRFEKTKEINVLSLLKMQNF